MKKLFTAAIIGVIFFAFVNYAVAGSEVMISPQEIWEGESTAITVSYMTDIAWYSGSIQLTIPDGWSPPNTNIAPGYVTAKVVMTGGGEVSYPVSINGQNIKIDGINMSVGDKIEIIYGDMGYPGYSYMGAAYFPFLVSVNSSGATVSAYNGEQPVLLVKRIAVNKSSNVTFVQAGDTIQYSINYMTNPMMGYEAFNTVIWDTLPDYLTYVSSSDTPSLISGNYLTWDIGTVSYYSNMTLTVTAVVNNNAYDNTPYFHNIAGISSEDMDGNSRISHFSNMDTIEVQGVVLESSIYAPDTVIEGQIFTVSMSVTNHGNAMATIVMPTVLAINTAGGNATIESGPNPSEFSGLIAGNGESFEWEYLAVASGQISFSGNAYGYSGISVVYSDYSESNWMNIEPQATVTSTSTPELPTETNTATQTPVVFTETATETPTETAVLTPVITDVPTDVPTAVNTEIPRPASTPNDPVHTDKNYFKPNNGETLELSYETPGDGNIEIKIMTLNGEVVKTLVKEYQSKGKRHIIWDAKNDVGNTVGRGIYFIHIKQGNWQVMKKVVVLK